MAAPAFSRAHHQQALHHTKGRNLNEVFDARLSLKRAAGGLEERIDVLLLDARGRLVELGLDCHPFTVILAARNQVNARIGLATVVAPLIPTLNLIELRRENGIGFEEVDHQLLKRDPVLALGLILTELIEDFAE